MKVVRGRGRDARTSLAMLITLGAGMLAPGQRAGAAPSVNLVSFATVDKVVDITQAGDSRLFVVDQDGEIRIVLADGTVEAAPFLDIQQRVIAGGERGLLGLAFHPDYAANGYFYVNYTRDPDPLASGEPGEGDTRISRFGRIGGPSSNIADPASEFVILDVPQPYTNHNAGDLSFGPDGYLWIPLGDGGSGGDPLGSGQDPNSLLGKMLRIDVGGGSPYAIPADNPYVGPDGVLDEIWAFGFRNPFRFGFDRATGDVWIADVGQGAWEEVDREPAGTAGGRNYGWRCYEGPDPYNTAGCGPIGSYTFPVHAYGHTTDGGISRCSITGGFVYRGPAHAAQIGGHYFFADYCSGNLYSLSPDGGSGYDLNSYGVLLPTFSASTFGENVDGELFIGTLGGTIYRLEASAPPTLSCPATPLASCRQPGATKGSLLIRNDPSDDSRDKLIWKWWKGEVTPKTAFGDPVAADFVLCTYDGTAVREAVIPGGASCPSCWIETRLGFKYRVSGPGVQRLTLRSGDEPGRARIVLKGKGTGLSASLPSIPVSQPVTVQLINSDGECWEATFSAPATRNERNVFKDRGN